VGFREWKTRRNRELQKELRVNLVLAGQKEGSWKVPKKAGRNKWKRKKNNGLRGKKGKRRDFPGRKRRDDSKGKRKRESLRICM